MFKVTWDSYKNNICYGFSHLQQREEFVDMTLAADGHFVKVHKNLIALASPYLKEIIQSAPCQHPVVFLTHISYQNLEFILEYIYTGEVLMPLDKLCDFIEASKLLKINGVHNLIPPAKLQRTMDQQHKTPDFVNFTGEVNSTNMSTTGKNIPVTTPVTNTQNNVTQEYYDSQTESINAPSTDLHLVKPGVIIPFSELRAESATSNMHLNDTDAFNLNQPKKPINKTASKMTLVDIVPENENNQEDCIQLDTDLEAGDNMDTNYCEKNPFDTEEDYDAMTGNEDSASNKNYSINVEMPDGNTGPPKITINAGVINNLPIASNTFHENEMQDNVNKNVIDTNSNSIPKITINAGNIQSEPYNISISKGTCPVVKTDASGEATTALNAASPLYMFNSKGSLQMILNRFIYGVHHHSRQGSKIRWRCIDYRHKRCPAYLDTLEDVIVNRRFVHNHPLHDEKIMKRGSRKLYESLKELYKWKNENLKNPELKTI